MIDRVFGIIAPHPPIMVREVGGSRAEVTHASIEALRAAADALAAFDPDLLVVMSPHAPGIPGAFTIDDAEQLSGSLAGFGDARVFTWRGDPTFAGALLGSLAEEGIPAVARSSDARLTPGALDHGVLVPLSFLDPMQHRDLAVLSLSHLSYEQHRALGATVASLAGQHSKRIAFIASGDLSHRLTPDAPAGYSPRAAELDEAIVGLVARGDLSGLMAIDRSLVEAGGECGLRSFIALGGFAGDDPVPTRVLAHEGPWGVGYLTALVGDAALEACDARALSTPEQGSKGGTAGSDESEIVALARSAIEAHVRSGRPPARPALAAAEYPAQAGVFVSLHRNGALRGCIGTILPTRDTLAEEVVHNAVQAAVEDPRFPALREEELADLDVKVDVLHAPQECTIDALDHRTHGVIVRSGWKRGLLLPDLEGVDDVETQVAIAMRKAGIAPDEPCGFERFRVDRYT